MSDDEEIAVAAGHGKWGQRGVPKKGWRCIGLEDLGSPEEVCEMCERKTIRHVQHMEHDEYPDVLRVGCVCAGHMEQDKLAAQRRDAGMKSRAGKRKRWLTRAWKVSKKGYPWLNVDGFRITVYPKGNGYGATVVRGAPPVLDATGALVNSDKEEVRHSRRAYATIDQAKLAAFDAVTELLFQLHTKKA